MFHTDSDLPFGPPCIMCRDNHASCCHALLTASLMEVKVVEPAMSWTPRPLDEVGCSPAYHGGVDVLPPPPPYRLLSPTTPSPASRQPPEVAIAVARHHPASSGHELASRRQDLFLNTSTLRLESAEHLHHQQQQQRAGRWSCGCHGDTGHGRCTAVMCVFVVLLTAVVVGIIVASLLLVKA